MYKIEWQGLTFTITEGFALKVLEAVGIAANTEDAPLVDETPKETNNDTQTSLLDYDLTTGMPFGQDTVVYLKREHAKGWRSHCARCGSVGRKCLERLNNRCHSCKDYDDGFIARFTEVIE